MTTKQEVLRAHLKEWLATKPYSKERISLRNKLSEIVKIHQNSVGRSMRRIQLGDGSQSKRCGRPRVYTKEDDSALFLVWKTMDFPCAEVLQPIMYKYIHSLKKHGQWPYAQMIEEKVLHMSMGRIRGCISSWRMREGLKRAYSATVPSPLKDMISIRKSHTWQNLSVGYVQTDTVVHCGDRLTDDVIYSIGCVDFRTYWIEYTAQWNKGYSATRESLNSLLNLFPFNIIEIHPDTGNEFINYHVKRWADDKGIDMTRSEPYKKNDNMCIEERNNNIVRRHLGYTRLDNIELISIAVDIMRTACILHNHFRPVRRMTDKERIGAHWHRTYEKVALTPYQRVMNNPDIPQEAKDKICTEHENLDPLDLECKLVNLKDELTKQLIKLKA